MVYILNLILLKIRLVVVYFYAYELKFDGVNKHKSIDQSFLIVNNNKMIKGPIMSIRTITTKTRLALNYKI